MNSMKWQSRFIVFPILCILLLPANNVAVLSDSSLTNSDLVNALNTGNAAWNATGQGADSSAKGCEPESKYPAADKATAFGGLAIEYTIQVWRSVNLQIGEGR